MGAIAVQSCKAAIGTELEILINSPEVAAAYRQYNKAAAFMIKQLNKTFNTNNKL